MTTDRRAALVALKDAVEAGDNPAFRRANRAVFSTPCQDITLQLREEIARHAYHGSTAAAIDLLLAARWAVSWSIMFEPGDVAREYQASIHYHTDEGMRFLHEFAPTPARALLLVILAALLEQEAQP